MIEFNGTCEADDSQFENRFIENLLEKLKQFPVCGDEVKYKSVWLYWQENVSKVKASFLKY